MAASRRAHPRLHRTFPEDYPRGGIPAAEGLLQALRHLDARLDDRARHGARRFSRFCPSDRSFATRAERSAGRRALDSGGPILDNPCRAGGAADMAHDELAKVIDDAFERRERIGPQTEGAVREAVESALELLDHGAARVAERDANGNWRVNQWLKKAVLLSFRLNDMPEIAGGPGQSAWWDKIASKFRGWS